MKFELKPRKCKAWELIKELEQEEKKSKRKEAIYRLADLYGIDITHTNNLKRIIDKTVEEKQQEVIEKHLIK